MTTPRLGIVTTCYGHAHFLPDCLASIAAQTSRDFCHVVVDDASPDASWPIIQQYTEGGDPWYGVRLDTNRGLAGAFHAGVAQLPPSVQWILKVDADDTIDPRYVEAILRAADEDPTRNVIFAPCRHFGKRTDVYVYPPFNPETMRLQFQIPGPAAYRRELWDAVGGYDVTMRSAEDWDFYIRAQQAVGLRPHQIRNVAGLYWHYRIHDGHRASSEGIKRLPLLSQYWLGHTKESALGRTRSWGEWCHALDIAA